MLTNNSIVVVGKTPRKKKVVKLINLKALGVSKKLDFDQPDLVGELDKLDNEELQESLRKMMINKDGSS